MTNENSSQKPLLTVMHVQTYHSPYLKNCLYERKAENPEDASWEESSLFV